MFIGVEGVCMCSHGLVSVCIKFMFVPSLKKSQFLEFNCQKCNLCKCSCVIVFASLMQLCVVYSRCNSQSLEVKEIKFMQ